MTTVGALAALAALSGGCGGASEAATGDVIRVEIHHSKFVPPSISVSDGQTARFVIHNADPIDHEFIVGDQATQDRHESGVELHHDGSVPGEITVPAGTTVTTSYRFDAQQPSLYGCHVPGHWAYGMRGTIEVRR